MSCAGDAPLPGGGRLATAAVRLVRRLGSGGMGVVYEGVQERTGRRVAVKLLLAAAGEGGAAGGGEGALADAAVRLADEARAAARIHHPDLVGIHAAGGEPGLGPFIVYELLEGGSLRDELRRRAGRPWPEALDEVADPLLGALQALHAGGVVHRDVKPENLLRGPDGRYKLTDLGLAVFEDRAARTATGVLLGTPGYLAPEFLGSGAPKPSARSDVYAAAMVVVESLLGTHPVLLTGPGASLSLQLSWEATTAELGSRGVPRHLAVPLAAALSRDPALRPASAEELLRELRRSAGSASPDGATVTARVHATVGASSAAPAPAPPAPPAAPARPRRSAPARVAALCAAAALVGAVMWGAAERMVGRETKTGATSASDASPPASVLAKLALSDGPLPRPATLAALLAASPREQRELARGLDRASPVRPTLRYLEARALPAATRRPEALRLLVAALEAAREAAASQGPSLPPDRLALERWLLLQGALAAAPDGALAPELATEADLSLDALASYPLAAVTSGEGSGLLATAEWLRCRAYYARPGAALPARVRSALLLLDPLAPSAPAAETSSGPVQTFLESRKRFSAARRVTLTIGSRLEEVLAARRQGRASAADLVEAWWALNVRALAPPPALGPNAASSDLVGLTAALLGDVTSAGKVPEWLREVFLPGDQLLRRMAVRCQVELRRLAADLAGARQAEPRTPLAIQNYFASSCDLLDARAQQFLDKAWSPMLLTLVEDAARWDPDAVATRVVRALSLHRQGEGEAAVAEAERASRQALDLLPAARGGATFGPALMLAQVAFEVLGGVAKRNDATRAQARGLAAVDALLGSLTPEEVPPGSEARYAFERLQEVRERLLPREFPLR